MEDWMSGWNDFTLGLGGYNPAPAAPAAAAPTPLAAVGNQPWYDQPGVLFDEHNRPYRVSLNKAGGRAYYDMPAWMPADPRAWYTSYQQTDPQYRPDRVLTEQSAAQARTDTEAARNAGRGALTGQMDRVQTAADSWANDPTREMVMEWMRQRAAPGYEFFTPTQRTAATLPVGQQYATNQMMSDASAAAHGGGGGIGLQNDAIMRGQAMTGGTMVRSQMDAAEQRLRESAIQGLSSTTGAYENVDQQYLNASNQLAGALAALEAGVDYQPTDYTVWPALTEAQRRADEEAQFRRDSLAAMEAEAEWGPQDWSNLLLSLPGTGIPAGIMGMLGG